MSILHHHLLTQRPHTRAILRVIRRINTPVVLLRVLLDVLPHLFDAEVELVVRLRLLVDEVVRVVGGLVRGAAGLREGCCGDRTRRGGEGGCAGGGEGEDAWMTVHVVHFESLVVGGEVVCGVDEMVM
jgi:hypothetical protein